MRLCALEALGGQGEQNVSSDSPAAGELARIETKIAQLCKAALERAPHYLLSELGKDLGEDVRRLKALTKQTLVDFVHERLPDMFQVVGVGKHKNVFAVIRAERHVNAEPTDEAPELPLVIGVAKKPRYNPRFWAAFAVPSNGLPRYLNLQDLTFREGPPPPAE